MKKRASKPNLQFSYWNMRRKGVSQSEIARQFGISRQAVSKSVKLQERDILFKLLDYAQASRVLVEWVSATKGLLVGIIPQLGNIACLVVMDDSDRMQMFYDPAGSGVRDPKGNRMTELRTVLEDALGVELPEGQSFKELAGELPKL